MDFKTMNKQRKFILLASITGIISIFLPWIDTTFENSNGLNFIGIPVLICFVVAAIISISGNKTLYLNKTPWILTLIAGGLALLITGIFFLTSMNSVVTVFGYGFSMAIASSSGVILAAYFFRATNQP